MVTPLEETIKGQKCLFPDPKISSSNEVSSQVIEDYYSSQLRLEGGYWGINGGSSKCPVPMNLVAQEHRTRSDNELAAVIEALVPSGG